MEADQYGSMEVARQIWAAILQVSAIVSILGIRRQDSRLHNTHDPSLKFTQAQPFTASLWCDFIQLEKTFGDKKHLRKAFQRALEKTFDHPEIIAKGFIQVILTEQGTC